MLPLPESLLLSHSSPPPPQLASPTQSSVVQISISSAAAFACPPTENLSLWHLSSHPPPFLLVQHFVQ